jgi:hypothetical protein
MRLRNDVVFQRWLTCVAADGEAMVRAQAFAGAHVQRAVCMIRRS